MQMRKCCNHPDLITGPFDGSTVYPPPEELVADCGVLQEGGGGRGAAALPSLRLSPSLPLLWVRGLFQAPSWASPPPPPSHTCIHTRRAAGKMALLDRLLGRLLPEGHKVLIFSQVGAGTGVKVDLCGGWGGFGLGAVAAHRP